MDVGQVHTEHIEITPALVGEFAKVAGDYNPIHLDAEYARTTPFRKPIAHGMLSTALLSGIIGTRFPGKGTILLDSGMKFLKPIFVGDKVLFKLTVEHVRPDKPIVTIRCQVFNPANEVTCEGLTIIRVSKIM